MMTDKFVVPCPQNPDREEVILQRSDKPFVYSMQFVRNTFFCCTHPQSALLLSNKEVLSQRPLSMIKTNSSH